jgi:hypothetical protein
MRTQLPGSRQHKPNKVGAAAEAMLKAAGPPQQEMARRPTIKELKIICRAHYGIGQGSCPLCGQSSQAVRTGTGLYDDGVHLGDLCKQCLHGGRRGASARTRVHSAELRRLAERVQDHPHSPECEPCYPWLRRYADFLEDLATRLESMTDWLPRSS